MSNKMRMFPHTRHHHRTKTSPTWIRDSSNFCYKVISCSLVALSSLFFFVSLVFTVLHPIVGQALLLHTVAQVVRRGHLTTCSCITCPSPSSSSCMLFTLISSFFRARLMTMMVMTVITFALARPPPPVPPTRRCMIQSCPNPSLPCLSLSLPRSHSRSRSHPRSLSLFHIPFTFVFKSSAAITLPLLPVKSPFPCLHRVPTTSSSIGLLFKFRVHSWNDAGPIFRLLKHSRPSLVLGSKSNRSMRFFETPSSARVHVKSREIV